MDEHYQGGSNSAQLTEARLPPKSFLYAGADHNVDDDGRPKRTGTLWTASAHIVTAVIGSGVLSLAWSMAKLGWVAGPSTLLAFALITYFTSLLLADSYRSSSADASTGKRNHTYMEAVRSNLGEVQTKFCMLAQFTNFMGILTGYTITTSISMVAIKKSNCFHIYGHHSPCYSSTYTYMKLFAAVEVVLSQIPNFSKLWWLSTIASVMSFSYSLIGIGLGISKVIENGHPHGTLGGLIYSHNNSFLHNPNHIWPIFQALGNIAFAYSYSALLIEIQDTLRCPPDESQIMKQANLIGVSTTTMFYMLCGCIGYLAFGSDAPGNILTGFGYYEPYWLIDLANAFVIIHLMGAYQVFCQPIFAFVESWVSFSFPNNPLIHKVYKIRIPFFEVVYHASLFRLVWRTAFVFFITLVAMILPFFNDILGIIGALAFWPLTVYFPIQIHITQSKIQSWSLKWLLLQTLSFSCLLISMVALIGSLQSVIENLKTYKPFQEHP